jgi:YkoP domain
LVRYLNGWRHCISGRGMTFDLSIQRSFARVVFAFDSRLRQRNGVFDYIDSPNCILRMKLERVGRRVVLLDGVRLEAADRIIELHYRNEYFPSIGAQGPTVAWARRVMKLMDLSLKELCEYLQSRPELDDVAAIRAVTLMRSSAQAAQFKELARRFGFESVPQPDAVSGRLNSVGQNLVGLLLILATNPRAAHLDFLLSRGAPIFISRRRLEERYRERRSPPSADGFS